MDKELKTIIEAVKAGGKVVRDCFGKALSITEKKGAWDLRTQADIGSEKAILEILRKEFPDYNIYSEEEGETARGSDFTFVIDPLDGTHNFVLGIPWFSVNVSLMKAGRVLSAATYHPILQETYYAQIGRGAFLDGKRLRVNRQADMSRAVIALGCGEVDDAFIVEKTSRRLYEKGVVRATSVWSPALMMCLLAAGKIEGMISFGHELYDFAAGKLIAREAGAKITDLAGNDETDDTNRFFVASNGTEIHTHLLEALL